MAYSTIIPAEYEQTLMSERFTPSGFLHRQWAGEWLRRLFRVWECWHWPDGLPCELKCKLVMSRWLLGIRPSLYAVSLNREIPEVFWIQADWNISALRFPWRGGKHSQGAVYVGNERAMNSLVSALMIYSLPSWTEQIPDCSAHYKSCFFFQGYMQSLSNISPELQLISHTVGSRWGCSEHFSDILLRVKCTGGPC